MASLSSNFNVGNVSAPSLVKSAATLQNEEAEYNDEIAKINWDNSGYTDAAFQEYQTYLQGRVGTLTSDGTPTDLTKAAEMTQDIVTATHSNISYHIQQDNIQVMSQGDGGTASGYLSKMNVIGAQYQTAVSIGDTTLADSLESQYYSVSQSYQSALQTSATAATTLANAQDSTGAANNEHVATTLTDQLKQLNTALSEAGPNGTNTAIQNWMKSSNVVATMKTLGVTVPGGAQPNYFDIVSGVTQAMANSHYQAYLALQGSTDASAPLDAQTYYQDAANLMGGVTKVSTMAGDMTLQDVQTASANPKMYVASENADGTWAYKQSSIVGYTTQGTTTNVNGQTVPNVVPEYSGTLSKATANQSDVNSLQKLGFTVLTKSGSSISNGYQVEANTNKLPTYLQKLMPSKNATFYVQAMANGSYQFVLPNSSGASQIISLATDGTGKTGAFDTTSGKPQAMGGEYGFDESANSMINSAAITQTRNAALQKQVATQAQAAQAQASAEKAAAAGKTTLAPLSKAPAPAPLKAPAPAPLPAPKAAPNALQKAASAPNTSGNVVERAATDVGHAVEGAIGAIGSLF